jgi:hypothetical protein
VARRRARPEEERGFWALVKKWGILIGVIGATLGVAFTLWDRFGPDPDPPVRRAELGEPAVEALTFRQYLQRVDEDPGGLDEETLARRGAFLEFDVAATGYKGVGLRLKWELIHAQTGDELGQEQGTTITPAAPEDTIAWHAFLPFPDGDPGPFRARIELLDGGGEPIARLRSDPFAA